MHEKKALTRKVVDNDLDTLNRKVLKIFGCCCLSLEMSFKALFERSNDAAYQVVMEDDVIDCMDRETRDDGRKLLSGYTLKPHQLRFILTLMSISSHLERIGDNSVLIARRAILLNTSAAIRETRFIEPVFSAVIRHAKMLYQACGYRNIQEIRNIHEKNHDRIDGSEGLIMRLTEASRLKSPDVPLLAELVFIARSLEEIWIILGKMEEDIIGYINS